MVVGISLVRNEEDIIGTVLAHMIEQVDYIIMLDNGSTDRTRVIIESFGIEVHNDSDPAHHQAHKMSWLAAHARGQYGASWVVPFDADEIWTSDRGRIRDVLEQLPGHISVVNAKVYDYVPTEQTNGNPVAAMPWRKTHANELPKVAARTWAPVFIDEGNHRACYPANETSDLLTVRHFPYRNVDQFFRKVRHGAQALRLAQVPDYIGAHWRAWDALSDDELTRAYWDTVAVADPDNNPDLVRDPWK